MVSASAVEAVMILVLYFVPSIVASNKRRRNSGAIFVLNLFLGWTAIGWVGALVWALTEASPVAREGA